MLKIASDLSLRVETVTQSMAILAKRRVGKSYTARRITEQLLKARQQVVIVDPKGDWWGIRSSADGKSPGFPVVILGGERGDVPLEVGAGEVVARLVAQDAVSALLDLSLFRKREVAVFMADFLENLYRIKAQEKFRTATMLVLDEADAIAPQKPNAGEERMLGAANDIVRRGGQRGLGCMLITQRSAVLSKDVLTQSEMLVLLRTISPQDRKAIDEWIDVHGTKEERKKLMDSLAALPRGQAWFWSPGWPTEKGIFQCSQVLPIDTFDSGATPKPGEKRREPKSLADVDLDSLQQQMAETIQRAKENDPKLLKSKIKQLETDLAKVGKARPAATAVATKPTTDQKAIDRALAQRDREWEVKIRETERANDAIFRRLNRGHHDALKLAESLHLNGESPKPIERPAKTTSAHVAPAQFPDSSAPSRRSQTVAARRVERDAQHSDDVKIDKAARSVLQALYWLELDSDIDTGKIAFYTDYSSAASTIPVALSRLRKAGFVEGFRLTEAGLVAVPDPDDARPTGPTLREWLRPKLDRAANACLDVLLSEPGQRFREQELCDATGYSAEASTIPVALSRLRKVGAAVGGSRDGGVRAAEVLFD